MLIRTSFIAATLIVLLGASAQAQAERPANGLGLFGGLASHTMSPQNSAAADYSSSGVSLGLDYQFGLVDSFSLNPFLISAGERVSGGISNATAGHAILGIEGRYWINSEYFLGAHVGSYSEVLQANSSNVSTSASGGGLGLTAGWENDSKASAFDGMFVAIQLDKAKIRYDNTDVQLSGLRLHVGYRWK